MSLLVHHPWLHRRELRWLLPAPAKAFLRRWLLGPELREEELRREALEMFGGRLPIEPDYELRHPFRLGIFLDRTYYFRYHLAACRELGVDYRLLDLERSDWLAVAESSGCHAFMAAPSVLRRATRQMADERLRVLSQDRGWPLYPSYDELWLWESKRRMREWLVAHKVPHPATQVFYDRQAAFGFAQECRLPIVLKMDSGAASSGVFVLRDRAALLKLIARAFGKGLRGRRALPPEPEVGSVILQEYVPHDHEWRVVRIGDSYLCRRKRRRGDYASGSGELEWERPGDAMLNFVEEVTRRGGFRSMAVDLYVTDVSVTDGPWLVNELQCLIGARLLPPTEHMGRWVRAGAGWSFDAGDFYRNACANLRVQMVLDDLCRRGQRGAGPQVIPADVHRCAP